MSVDILLSLALHEVHTEAYYGLTVNYLFKVYVGCVCGISDGCKEVAVHCACEVKSFAYVVLCKIKLVCYILCGSLYVRGNVKIGCKCIDLNIICLFNVGCTLAASLNGDSYGGGLFGKSYGKLAVCYGSIVAVRAPSKLNLGICSTGKRKGDLSCLIYGLGKVDLGKSNVDLLCGSSLNLFEILEGSCGNRADVDSVAVYVNNTGNVCKIISLCKMLCKDCSFLLSVDNANGEVGGVNSYVGLKSALHLEVEVLSLFAKILLADNYALDGYKSTESVAKISSLRIGVVLEEVGNIGRSESGDGAIGNGNGSILDLVSLTVNFLDTGNGYLHTNLKAVFCNVVLGGVVYVVTVNAVHILDEELVTGVACALGTSEGYDTFDSYGVAGNLLKVLSVSKKLVLGNLSLEGNGSACTVCRIDGCGKVVNEVLGSLLINVDGNVFFVNNYLNKLAVGSPGYVVSNLLDEYLLRYGEVVRRLIGLNDHHLINVVLCSLYVVANCGFFGFIVGELNAKPAANGLLNSVKHAAYLTLDLIERASCKAGEYEYHNDN